jgi:hypothetical protein
MTEGVNRRAKQQGQAGKVTQAGLALKKHSELKF